LNTQKTPSASLELNDLLSFTKIDTTKNKIDPNEINLQDFLSTNITDDSSEVPQEEKVPEKKIIPKMKKLSFKTSPKKKFKGVFDNCEVKSKKSVCIHENIALRPVDGDWNKNVILKKIKSIKRLNKDDQEFSKYLPTKQAYKEIDIKFQNSYLFNTTPSKIWTSHTCSYSLPANKRYSNSISVAPFSKYVEVIPLSSQ
jgi:hypothetical protein